MSESSNKYEPLYISSGDLLTPNTVNGAKYSFQRMNFSQIAVKSFPDNLTSISDFMPKGINQIVCFENIGSMINFENIYDFNGDKAYLNKHDVESQNSGFISSSKSLIPQILCNYNLGENIVELESNMTTHNKKHDTNEKVFKWRLQDQYLVSKVTDYKAKIEDHAVVNRSMCNGLKASVVLMTGMKKEYDDFDKGTFDRYFISDLPDSGVYGIYIDFSTNNTRKDGSEKDSSYVDIIFDNLTIDYPKGNTPTIEYDRKSVDRVVLRISPSSEMKINLGNNKSSGELKYSDIGISAPFSNCKNQGKLILLYSLLNKIISTGEFSTDPESPTKVVKCSKDIDLDMSTIASPSYEKFPEKHKKGKANAIFLCSQKVYVSFGEQVEIHWHNCYGSFAMIPLRYCPKVKFSYFYRLNGKDDFTRVIDSSEHIEDTNPNVKDYFTLEYGTRYYEKSQEEIAVETVWKNLRNKFYPTRITDDNFFKTNQSSIYRVDFEINANNTYRLQNFPFEIFSLIHISKRKGKLAEVLNGDGDFSSGFNSNVSRNKYVNYVKNSSLSIGTDKNNWMKFITDLSVSHSLEGSSGSITLDKYMMMDIADRPSQAIGALTLKVNNGFYRDNGKTINGTSYSVENDSQYSSLPWGQIFKGYAMKIQDSVSDGQSSLTIELQGVQEKLKQMTLINCPFWDGDKVFGDSDTDVDSVMAYMKCYTGCSFVYNQMFSNGDSRDSIILPRSMEWVKNPAVNFVMGTPVYDALVQIGKFINHRFLIQPDGKGYFYKLDDEGKPEWVKKSPIRMKYNSSDIISMNISPRLENRYNTFLTLGLLGKNNPDTGRMEITDTIPGYKISQKSIEKGDYPWSRIITNKEAGIVTMSQLEQFHKTNERFACSEVYEGSITVPGFHKFYLYDKISIDNIQYYIIGINHNISLANKQWTTSLQLGKQSNNGYKLETNS